MNEKKIQGRLKKTITAVAATGGILLAAAGFFGFFLLNSVERTEASVRMSVIALNVLLFALLLWMLASYIVFGNHIRSLHRLAFYDRLTGACNFLRFRAEAAEAAEKNCNCTLVSLNIHQFKFINEIFGKEQGDRVLRSAADIISKNLNENEIFCRESADFFYLFLRETEAQKIEQRLRMIMSDLSKYGEKIGCHIFMYCGAVISDEMNDIYSLEQMLTHVMFALAKARETHQNNVWFFDTGLHEKERLDHYIESHMYQALNEGEFTLWLQVKKDLVSGEAAGAEALVRWKRKDGTVFRPDQFIPLFEKNGFCTKLDMYMIEKVCACIRGWMDQGGVSLPVSVNQSKAAFYKPDYVQKLSGIISRYGVPAELITLEILEGAALENTEEFNRTICRLRKRGFQVSMDDFGSGYSSLNTLGSLHIDEVKLDRGFLREVSAGENEKMCLIMEQIIKLAEKLQIRTVVEGVETGEDERIIREWGCDIGQGYYYGRPVSAEEFTAQYIVKNYKRENQSRRGRSDG